MNLPAGGAICLDFDLSLHLCPYILEECSGSVVVLDLGSQGHMFETHWRHCHSVVSLSKTLYPLLSTGSAQED